MAVWEVDLFVEGPITLGKEIQTIQQKGNWNKDPFYSDIRIKSAMPSGLLSKVTARSDSQGGACQAAVVFFGQMLDTLTLDANCPMYLKLSGSDSSQSGRSHKVHAARRIIGEDEIKLAFNRAFSLRSQYPSFLRGLSWYRKGLFTEEPFDSFLALWNAIELVSSSSYKTIENINKEYAKKGAKNQIEECFRSLWGDCESWPVITNNSKWISDNHKTRTDIAHGSVEVTVEKIASVSSELPVLRQVAHHFLDGWLRTHIKLGDGKLLTDLS